MTSDKWGTEMMDEMVECPSCKATVRPVRSFTTVCPNCGHALEE